MKHLLFALRLTMLIDHFVLLKCRLIACKIEIVRFSLTSIHINSFCMVLLRHSLNISKLFDVCALLTESIA